MDKNQRFAYLFNRYFNKECSQAEKEELFELLRHSEHDEELRRLIDETWTKDLPAHRQSKSAAKKILARILRQEKRISPRLVYHRPVYVLRYAAAAAVLLLLVTGIFLAYYHTHHSSSPLQKSPEPPLAKADQYLILPDGSQVLLHEGAHVNYPVAFTGRTRDVYLEGEAYFEIKTNKQPFIVHTGKVRTTVLGTAFNINAYARNIVVTVTKGKVKVENEKGDFSILRPNEQATVDVANDKIRKGTVDAGEFVAWKKPYLLFNDVTMKEAVQELQQHFKVTIVFDNPALENCNVTASFTRQESLEQILQVLTKINNMEYTMVSPSQIRLGGEGCN